jgi:hypothetical protein
VVELARRGASCSSSIPEKNFSLFRLRFLVEMFIFFSSKKMCGVQAMCGIVALFLKDPALERAL